MRIKEIQGIPDYQKILPLLKAEWKEWPEDPEHRNDSDQEIVKSMIESHIPEADITKYLIEDDQIIGFYRYTKIPRDSKDTKTVHTMDISILPAYQKQGLGSLLFKDMIEDARFRGFECLQSRTIRTNTASNALHKKIGFKELFEKGESIVWEISL